MCEQYRETVNLSIPNNSPVGYLNFVGSNQRVKIKAAIGYRPPVSYPSSGKAILAFSPDEV